MYSFGTLIITGLICLLIGGAVGAALFKLLGSRGQNRAMEERAYRAEEELKRYQQDVAEHFAKTSELVNGLTQSYRDVYEHLANSALKLTTPALSRQILESANTRLLGTGGADRPYLTEEQVEAPRDWAPKSGTGQLSEEYGLNDDDLPENPYDRTDDTQDDEAPELLQTNKETARQPS